MRLRPYEEASDRLELLDVANTSPNSIEVSWRPPSKNADRVHHYKLMMATNTHGVVKAGVVLRTSTRPTLGRR